ncbi:hypothetical protein GCM10009584_12190 [Ornithinimicrobium humiphilum]|uniref:Sortase family protein n=1 Tax=Ornithinimicrobium humiphilum TaxID=125288 RepID=A0A543KJR3_9MICO|nr:class F sortase [Ornithinimicrobium humiphilum]TQM95322.1 sortase family protein [Ornithinimicrobium humiphilum]
MRPRTRRRTRVDLTALLVTVVCVAVAGWALRGLLADPVPQVDDFGTPENAAVATAGSSPSDDPAGATAVPDDDARTTAVPDPERGSAPVPPTYRSASLAERPARDPAPVRLRVPSVGLDVPLDAVAVAADGQMEVPDDASRAGWYRHGPPPGSAAGSAVVAGHVDDPTGPGAFLALTEAAEGDDVLVDLEDGTTVRYRITARETVAKPELAVDDLFRRDGPSVLRLVTCTGEWSRATGHYTDNLVLTAEPSTS